MSSRNMQPQLVKNVRKYLGLSEKAQRKSAQRGADLGSPSGKEDEIQLLLSLAPQYGIELLPPVDSSEK